MMAMQPTGRRDRHRALAELEAEICRAETTRARWSLGVEDAAASGGSGRRARAMLGMAQEHLGLLRGSRSVLLRDGATADDA